MIWNYDMAMAPRGRHETRARTIKNEKQEYDVFIPERVLLAHPRDGLVYASYWIEPNKFCARGRWAGWREGDEPLAWQAYPEHPFQAKASDDNGATVQAEKVPADSVTGDVSRSSRGDDSPASASQAPSSQPFSAFGGNGGAQRGADTLVTVCPALIDDVGSV